MSSRRSPVSFIVAAVAGVLLIAGVRLLSGGSGSPDEPEPRAADGSCATVTVAASSEKAALLRDIAAQWNSTEPQVGDRCVEAVVVPKASGAAAAALAGSRWDEDVDGPRPDVWSPASSTWAGIVQQGRAAADLPPILPDRAESVAQTPLVIAMPDPMARALGWPDKQLGWSDLSALALDPRGWGSKGHPEWGRFRLGKTNPHLSTSGLNATIGTYFAATGLSSDLSVDDVQAAGTRKFVSSLESSVVHYGDTTLTFLSNMAKAADRGRGLTYVSAVAVEEKSVLDYNSGNPTGDPATAQGQALPQVPLAAVYPKEGTLLSDNPWYVLDAAWVDAVKRQAAADLFGFIRADEQQARFQSAGFRTYDGVAGGSVTPDNGLLPDQPESILFPPEPKVLSAVQSSWDRLRKRAKVLLVVDVSGSMGESVPQAGVSRLELAKSAAASAVSKFAYDDEVGLWIFSTDQGSGGRPYRQLVPVGQVSRTGDAIESALNNLVPGGGTGLYATLRVAQAQMRQGLDQDRINAIVLLSDGRNEYPPDTDLDGLLDELTSEDASLGVRVFPIGYSGAADADALRSIADASAGAYYDASDPTTIDAVLTSVVSNF